MFDRKRKCSGYFEYPITLVLDKLSAHQTPRIYGASTIRSFPANDGHGPDRGSHMRTVGQTGQSKEETLCREPPAFSSLHPIAHSLRNIRTGD